MTITNFASGELSQNLKGRVDLPQYYAGAQKIENFDIIPTGGIKRRPGMQFMGSLMGECRLVPFIINKDLSFIMEFVPHVPDPEDETDTAKTFIYFWRNGERMYDLNNNPIVLEAPYRNLDEINKLQYAQNYDIMIFASQEHAPRAVKYEGGESAPFSISLMGISYYMDPNIDDDYDVIKIVPQDRNLPLEAKTDDYCVYRGHLWKCSKGNYIEGGTEYAAEWEMQGDDPTTDAGLWDPALEKTERQSENEGKYPGCVTFFQNRLFYASTKNQQQRIWASATPDTENMRYGHFGLYQKFITVNKAVKDPDIHVFSFKISKANISESGGYTILTDVSQDLRDALKKDRREYYLTCTEYFAAATKVLEVEGNSIKVSGTPVITWGEDESSRAGITGTISLWRSSESASAEDYEYIVVNNNMVTADCAFYLEPASDQNDAIKWLAPSTHLCIGTESNVWNIPSGVSALNVSAYLNGRYGSDDIQAHVVDQAVIFFAQGKCGIREYYYNSDKEAFQTNNIAIMAEHLLSEKPAIDFDFCTNPYNRLVIVREDGIAVTLLYDKTNGIMGWNRIRHASGEITSCAITRGSGYSDLIYFAIKEGEEYSLQMIDFESEVFLDGWRKGTDEEVLLDGEEKVTYGEDVYIGKPYESLILSMPVVTQDISQKKRIVNLYVRFNNSYMPVMKTTGMPDEFFIGVEAPFSGVKKIDYPGTSDIDVTFELTYSEPHQCNILSVDASVA